MTTTYIYEANAVSQSGINVALDCACLWYHWWIELDKLANLVGVNENNLQRKVNAFIDASRKQNWSESFASGHLRQTHRVCES